MATATALLEYLTTTRIGEKGQITVPKQFRADLQLTTGAPFAVLRLGDGLILLPEQHRFDRMCMQISEALRANGITPAAVLATLSVARQRVYQRHYGAPAKTQPRTRTSTKRKRKS